MEKLTKEQEQLYLFILAVGVVVATSMFVYGYDKGQESVLKLLK